MKLFRNMDWDNATVNQFIAGIDAAIASNSLGGGAVESHSGTSGLDRLEHFDAGMGASTVLGTGTAGRTGNRRGSYQPKGSLYL
jgi:hypothetical protein